MSDRSLGGQTARGDRSDAGQHSPLLPLHTDKLPPPFGTSSAATTAKPVISLPPPPPPPPPPRVHSYHPLSSSGSMGAGLGALDRERQPSSQQSWRLDRAEGARSEAMPSELPRFLVQRTSSSSTAGPFQLPPLSASFGSSSAWRTSGNGEAMRRSPMSPDGRGSHLDAFRENAAMMMASRPDDGMLGPHSPPLGVSASVAPLSSSLESASAGSGFGRDGLVPATRKMAKAHVPSACLNCKRAHLACDVGRPCRRCVNLGKSDTCIDVQHKKRGRPRLKDRQGSQSSASRPLHIGDGSVESDRASTSPSSMGLMRYSPQSEPAYFRSPPRPPGALSPPVLASPSVHRLPGPTHTHIRTPSASVSASSYPFSRPDNVRTFSDGQASAVFTPFTPTASAVVTIICSTNLQCARVSEDCAVLLGYQPSEVLERSLFEFVHPAEASRLEELWTSLIDPVGVVPQAVPASADVVMSTPPARLMAPAAGTIFVQENMRLRQRNGMYDFYSIRLHLGGGFGVDLYRRETLDRAYIVASLLKLGNDATHPEVLVLRNPYHGGQGPSGNAAFWTPTAQAPANHGPVTSSYEGQQRSDSGLPAYASHREARADGGTTSTHGYLRSPGMAGSQALQLMVGRGPAVQTERGGHQQQPARVASESSAAARDAAALKPAALPPSNQHASSERPVLPPLSQTPLSRMAEAEASAGRNCDAQHRRDEAVPSYSQFAGRGSTERMTMSRTATVRPAPPAAGASSPLRKRRSSISLSASSPHGSSYRGSLPSSNRTSSRDGIAC
ncbi:hypothetical protein ACQY0O_002284 [Thecaphora frezii]